MRRYDNIVVGSGASGLTAALLLAQQGKRVLIVEKAPQVGGSLARFKRNGVPFDVGLHFTGGFTGNSFTMLEDMLKVLGIREDLSLLHPPPGKNHRILFSELDQCYDLPAGIDSNRQYLKSSFPTEKVGIDAYFDRLLMVCRNTASMDLRRLGEGVESQKEDWLTLQQVLDELIADKVLQGLLSLGCMCYGSKPEEVSFANHCRMVFGLHDGIARIRQGGDALVEAFSRRLNACGVEIRTRTEIVEMTGLRERRVRNFVLSDGSEVTAENCVLAIHPQRILELLPPSSVSPAFINRVAEFEPSIGFFSMFGILEGEGDEDFDNGSIFSLLPNADINRALTAGAGHPLPVVMFGATESVQGRPVRTVTAFEVSFREHVELWEDTRAGCRGDDYINYKKDRVNDMLARLQDHYGWLKNHFHLMASGSMLTFRDYLNSPYGSAYGIRQKIGQFNLIGKLPVLNLYAAGQSALLPGVLGAMASGFFVVRSLVGKHQFQNFIEGRLWR